MQPSPTSTLINLTTSTFTISLAAILNYLLLTYFPKLPTAIQLSILSITFLTIFLSISHFFHLL